MTEFVETTDKRNTLVVNTEMLLLIANTADRLKLNRRLVTDQLVEDLDPNGIHVISPLMMHNESEMRVHVLMKMKNNPEPTAAWVDVPLDVSKSAKAPMTKWSDVQDHSKKLWEILSK